MSNLSFEHSYKWTNGVLEFESDIEMREYFEENGLPNGEQEFTRVQKIIVKDV